MTNAQATFQAEELWYYNIGISSSLKQMRWFDLSEADSQNAKISHKYFCLLLIDRLTNDIFCFVFINFCEQIKMIYLPCIYLLMLLRLSINLC